MHNKERKKEGFQMKGNELVKWIEENNAGEHVIIAVDDKFHYMKAKGVWEGESEGGAIMIEVDEDTVIKGD